MARWGIVAVLLVTCSAAAADGPIARWTFDEGTGDVAHDTTGNGADQQIHGATWIKQGSGHALSFDGQDDYLKLSGDKRLAITGPITIEAWINPARKPGGESHLFGEGMRSYGMTIYNTQVAWYLGHGNVSNYLYATPKIGRWNHLVATFDGKHLVVWLDGHIAASRASNVKQYETARTFQISGSGGDSEKPRFVGMIDNVRVYDRAISEAEVLAHVQQEAGEYGHPVITSDTSASQRSTEFFKTHPNEIDVKQDDAAVLFANREVGLALYQTPGGFQLGRLYGVANDHDMLAASPPMGYQDLFELVMTLDPKHVGRDERWMTRMGLMSIISEMAGDAFTVGSHSAKQVSWRHEEGDGKTTLILEWKNIDVKESRNVVDVQVIITLRAGDPLTYWRFVVKNRGGRYGIERVRFPMMSFKPIDKSADDVFVFPLERGSLVENPYAAPTGFGKHLHTEGGFYPINFNMQFQAMYDGPTGKGIFMGTRDPAASMMTTQLINTRDQLSWRPGHFPPNMTFASEDFELKYDCVVGPFQGDWFDACNIYRRWALKQSWSRKGPLRTRKEAPKWFKEAPIHFYTHLNDSFTGTHDESKNLVIAADHLREWTKWAGMPLGANFYAWKQYQPKRSTYNVPFNRYRHRNDGRWAHMQMLNSHDGNYPKIPALPNLSSELRRLQADGGMVCPYVPLEIFDQGSTENSPYAKEAKPNITRDLYGALRVWGTEMSWQPCAWTPWWRNRLKETCKLMLQRENVSGFYFDVMQGTSLPCYWTPHGHSACGADSMSRGMHGLCEILYNAVKAQDPSAITTGENATENMFDVIDGTLQATLSRDSHAPLLAAVYQDYMTRYGLKMSATMPGDSFFIECASLFVEGTQIGMLALRPRANTLSFQDDGHKPQFHFLAQIVGYYRQPVSRDFLAYGQLMRPLTFDSPIGTLKHCDSGEFPTLMSGVFSNGDSELGVFITNAGEADMKFSANLELSRHGLSADSVVSVDIVSHEGNVIPLQQKVKGRVLLSAMIPGRGIVMYYIKPR